MARLALAPVLALTLAACSGDQAGTGFGTGITTAPGTSSTSSTGDTGTTGTTGDTSTSTSTAEDSAAANANSSSGTASTDAISDVGVQPDGGSVPVGCKGKIDLLFTISSSFTMENQQDRLKAAFPGFIATLESEFADFDYHILSANTSGLWGHPVLCAGCKDVCPEIPEYPCGVEPEICDTVHGAGVTYPIGKNASNTRCELASGRRYITTDQPDLQDAFTCIASVGTSGADAVAEVTVKALADEINAPGGCNEGFLRDDALLFVVAIQDTYDDFSDGTPQDWADALVQAKGGDADAVVLLVLSTDVDKPGGLCGLTIGEEHNLRTWTELLPHGLFRSVCAEDYAPFFAEAAALLKEQCDVFVPQ